MFFVRFVAAILGGILDIGFQAILQMLLTLFKAVSTQQTFDLKTGGLTVVLSCGSERKKCMAYDLYPVLIPYLVSRNS